MSSQAPYDPRESSEPTAAPAATEIILPEPAPPVGLSPESSTEPSSDLSSLLRGPDPAPASSPPGRLVGMGAGLTAFALGTGLMIAAYIWAFLMFQSNSGLSPGSDLTRPVSDYTQWGISKLFFLLGILLQSFAGWLIAGRGSQLFSGGSKGHSSTLGMIVGLLVFCGGIGLVVLVFLTAMQHFPTGAGQIPNPPTSGGKGPDYIGWALGGLFQILVLALMAINGSLITSRGSQLFLGAIASRSTRETS